MSTDHAEIYAPEYGKRHMSNHFPMAAFALKNLGADQVAIEALNQSNLKSLDLNRDVLTDIEISDDNFDLYLGKREAYSGYYAYFKKRVVLGEKLPRIDFLAKGVSAGAFHALIRIGYGLDAGVASEVAAGLAYLADGYLEVAFDAAPPTGSEAGSVGEIAQKLLALRLAGKMDVLPSDGVIFERMDVTAQEEERQKIISSAYYARDVTLEKVAQASLGVFLHTGNFTALHAVTASHAARLVLPYVEDQEEFLRQLFAGIVTAVLTISGSAFRAEAFEMTEPPSPEELSKKARKSSDSHDIKLVYSCLEEYEFYQDKKYLAAAALQLRD